MGPFNSFLLSADTMLSFVSRGRWRNVWGREDGVSFPGSDVTFRQAFEHRQLLRCQAPAVHGRQSAPRGQQLSPGLLLLLQSGSFAAACLLFLPCTAALTHTLVHAILS